MTEQITIRLATPEDATAIATAHVLAWQSAYRGVVPDEYLDALTVEARAKNWQRNMMNPLNQMFVYVAETAAGQVVGFASGGPPQTPDTHKYKGELYAIYLLPEHQHQGTGTRMTHAIVSHLRDLEVDTLIIWVLADNPNSRAFYEKLGGTLAGKKMYDIGGKELEAVAYVWETLDNGIFE